MLRYFSPRSLQCSPVALGKVQGPGSEEQGFGVELGALGHSMRNCSGSYVVLRSEATPGLGREA